MFRLLLFCSTLHIVLCLCPSNTGLYRDGQCRGRYSHGSPYVDTAINDITTTCNNIKAVPYSIHDDEQLSWWSSWDPSNPGYFNVMGLLCNTNSKKWEWADGTTLDFKPPSGKYDKELDEDCKVCSWILSQDSYWSINCTHATHGVDYYCTYQLPHPTPSTDCGNFVDGEDDTHCYEIAAKAENWNDAQTVCHSFGSELASVHNKDQNAYIRRLAISRGAVNGVLLGGTISGKGNDFGWIDGSDWDYTNFYPSFPIDGLGACLAMDTETTAGQWMNTDCTAKLPVVCSRPLYSSPAAECTGGPWKEGQVIYTPGFPDDASIPCDYFFTVATGKQVKVKIMLLEANSCCDRLILSDGYIGGTVLANLTGEIGGNGNTYHTSTSNTMRVSWQPTNGVGVRGVMMAYWVN